MSRKQMVWIYIAVVGIAAAMLLKTVWWSSDQVFPEARHITEALVVEVSDAAPHSRQAYAHEDTVAAIAEVFGGMKLKFDRKSDTFAYDSDAPSYDLMLSGDGFSYGVIFVSGSRMHYNNTIYIMDAEAAAALNDLLASCFS